MRHRSPTIIVYIERGDDVHECGACCAYETDWEHGTEIYDPELVDAPEGVTLSDDEMADLREELHHIVDGAPFRYRYKQRQRLVTFGGIRL